MKKTIGLVAVMSLMLIGAVWGVSCVFDQSTTSGTASTYIRGAQQNLSVVVSGWARPTGDNATNGTISVAGGTITGALTYIGAGGVENATAINTTVNTGALVDTTTYTFTMTLYNSSAESIGSCTTTLIADNTVPTCVHSQASRTSYKSTQTWTVAGVNASSATIAFDAQAGRTMSEVATGDSFTWTGTQQTLPEGVYTAVKAITSDGLNSTTCVLSYVTIDMDATLKQVAIALATEQAGAKTANVSSGKIPSALIVILLAGAGWYLFIRKKKR